MALFYTGDLISMVLMFIVFLIVSIILSIFSPFGIGFAVFSVIRGKTENSSLKKVSLVFQIILSIIGFILAFVISILFSIKNSGIYLYNQGLIATIAVILGAGFVFALEIGITLWQSAWLRKKED